MKARFAISVLIAFSVALAVDEAWAGCCNNGKRTVNVKVEMKAPKVVALKTRPRPDACRICGATMAVKNGLCPSHRCSKHDLARPDGKCARCEFAKDVRNGKATCGYCGRRAVALVEETAGKGAKRTASASAQDPVFIRVCAAHYCREHGLALQKDKLDEFFCPECQAEAKKEKLRQAKREREARAEQRQARHSSSGRGL